MRWPGPGGMAGSIPTLPAGSTATEPRVQGGSSIGRVAVSKTVGWGFESLPPCHSSSVGEVAERLNAAVLKTAFRVMRNGGSNPSLSARVS